LEIMLHMARIYLVMLGSLLLVACGASDEKEPSFGLPADETASETYDLYAPYGRATVATFVDLHARSVAGQWSTVPVTTTRTDVAWGDPANWADRSVEEHEIKTDCAGGRSWIWLSAYRSPRYDQRYAIETTKAVLRIGERTWDITSGGNCGTEGQPYALYHVFPTPYELAVWGKIYSADRSSFRRFFWQHRIASDQIDNPCWKGAAPTTRQALRQDELWWDGDAGFTIGAGTLGADGLPDGTGLVYGRYQYIAKNAGFVWRVGQSIPQSAAWEGCLETTLTP
jgi:hypothetical protein